MNKHIKLVKKWLDDPDSVTKEKIKANADAADAAWAAARAASNDAANAESAAEAACDVYDEADEAAYAEAHDKYFSLKEEYENE